MGREIKKKVKIRTRNNNLTNIKKIRNNNYGSEYLNFFSPRFSVVQGVKRTENQDCITFKEMKFTMEVVIEKLDVLLYAPAKCEQPVNTRDDGFGILQ